jgi:cytoskeletal protein RodZ
MLKRLAVLAMFGVLGLGGAGVAALAGTGSSSPNPSQQCRAEQADPNFASNHGGKTFAQYYGTNANEANAFGKCVSAKSQAESTTTATTTTTTTTETTTTAPTTTSTPTTTTTPPRPWNAARACRAERALDRVAFKAKYGTNNNKSNAFGKCVSARRKHHKS